MSAVLLGTSGWTYEHWKEIFYPQSIPKKKWFEYYTSKFETVELNASFYRIPTSKAAQGWFDRSPDLFKFSVKMSRLITHIKKLKNCNDELQWFFTALEPLHPKISTILIQLPPSLKFDSSRISEFSLYLPENFRYVFEFRNSSWYRSQTYDLLGKLNHHFCIHDMADLQTEKVVISDLAYIRFHGFDSIYGGDYSHEILKKWAQWIISQQKNNKTVFGYFNNDIGGMAVKNCQTLKRLIEQLA